MSKLDIQVEGAGENKSSEEVEPVNESKVEEVVVAEETNEVEEWFSFTDPNHMIVIPSNKKDEKATYAKFASFGLKLDLSNPEDRLISEGLHGCGREGRDIFVLGTGYKDHENGEKVEFMSKMRAIASEPRGFEKLRGMFTGKELYDANLDPLTDDVDALITLALRIKSI